ncbi:class I lanthipeptide [Mucilaginibacter sp. KACC 22063]|uniref:class I lanthipeptide n=1 Tax=Mucilaginibacter sp. KACC 22063 TaxID=3025666 RepID=UPI0023671BC3|nr:class I lanthipeptide [Mucilaginibacter sp. KACC 22063]WDF56042.1 class I lanthipeptide [Mucilaginibacter sp. KACC 22063]
MKKKRIHLQSLSFEKETIAKLNEHQLGNIHGGINKETDPNKCSCPVMSCIHLTESCLTVPKQDPEEN